jgi:GNAT superfamily N-acetyltransferase
MELVLATEAQKRARDLVTHAAWGERLTVDSFVARELRLRGHPWARETMRTWFLVDGGETLASCETFRMKSWLRRGGRREEGFVHAIASVFTEPALRGRGHATAMMRRLVERTVRAEPEAHGLALFSDVGPALYARAGFRPTDAHDVLLEAAPGDPSAVVDALIDETDVPRALASIPLPDVEFLVWPTAAQLDWHLERERAYAELLARPRPVAAGARAGRSVLLWAGDLKNDRLAGLVMHADDAAEASALLEAARRVAARAGLAEVRLWEVPRPFAAPGTRVERDGSLPMLCPLAGGLTADAWERIPRALWV